MNNLKNVLKSMPIVSIELINKTQKVIRYQGHIEEIDEQTITLSISVNDENAFISAERSSLNIWFWNNDAIYIFSTKLCQVISGNSNHQLIIAIPDKISRVQERDYVRVDYILSVIISYLNDNGEEEVVRCKSQDMSGGGMLIVMDTFVPLKKGSKVQLKFTLDDTLINVEGEIVRNEWKLDYKGIEHNYIGVNFINILEKYRKLIIKCVYNNQIELKRKGLL